MTIYERIKELVDEHHESIRELEHAMNWSNGTISKWAYKAPTDKLQKIADRYTVSVDYLLGRTNKRNYYELTKKEELDIADMAEKMIQGIDTGASVNFYGEPMTDDQKESMRDIIEMGLRINKEKAKKKFTPKKYRDNRGD